MTESNSDHASAIGGAGAGSGLSRQNASLTVLVASTLGASLSAVPKSQEAQAVESSGVVNRTISQEDKVRHKSPERRASHPSDSSNLDTGSRKRFSHTRLHFNSKKSAGSESSRGEALTKQESFSSVSTSPPGMATATSRQMSQTSLSSE